MKQNQEQSNLNKEQREVKSTVFTDIFCEDEHALENARSLFNALHDETLPEGCKIQVFRLAGTMYMNFKNDMTFNIQEKLLVFGEHQSTINRNMPLRDLMYTGRAYEQLIPVRDRYRKGMVKIPLPEFYMFYNGCEKYPKELTLKLSDAFKVQADDPMLELKVKVININFKEGHEILERCPILKEYSIFINTIRKYQEQNEEDCIKKAMMECIENGILVDYLQRKGSQVNNMLIAEYDYDLDIEVQREEAWEDGKMEGKADGKAEDIIELLEDLGEVPQTLKEQILGQRDLEILKVWIKKAARVSCVAEFEDFLKNS